MLRNSVDLFHRKHDSFSSTRREKFALQQKFPQVSRWSGEGVWIPMGDTNLGLAYENATSHSAPGDVIVHPGGISETEILLAYGPVSFSSKVGQLLVRL